jgi:serine/threonine protein kinase
MDRREVTVKQRLGEGQFGIVNCGEWRGTPVAVKTFKGSDLITEGEITQELSMLQGLHHPHVIQFIGACTKVTPYFLVTELALGGSLADVFNMRVQPGVKRCLVIALHAARGMAYLHGRKPHPVIHRDLKPANIMVCGHVDDTCTRKDLVFRHGVVKVADFGLSRSLQGGDDEELHPGQTAATAPLAGAGSPSYEMTGETGSYRYMAPEVFKHQRYGHKVDIFAYGVIIFQLFEKRVPFEGLAPEAMARMVAEKNLRPAFAKHPRKTRGSMMAQTPAAVRQLIQECWHPQPERRPEFSEICKRLEAVIAGTTKKKPEPGGAGPGAGRAAGGTSGGSATSTLAAFLGSLGFNKTPSR